MKVKVSRPEVAKLRRRMKHAFPKERIEYIWGTLFGDTVHIHIFDQVPHTAARTWCEVSEHDHEASAQACQDAGFVLLGSVHSHPGWRDASPSETDHDGSAGEIINGVVAVWKDDYGRLRSRIRWWGPTLPLETIQT